METKLEEIKQKIESEGNEFSFVHKGINCEIKRPTHPECIHWCGYVETGLSEELTFNQKCELSVHGGITFNQKCDDKFIIGFDCAHSYDIFYIHKEISFIPRATYKDKEYVINETKLLAEQVLAKRFKWKVQNFIRKFFNIFGWANNER